MRDKSLCSGERQHADHITKIDEHHKWRYREACKYINNKTVLDLGCGVGYGSKIMSIIAKHVRSEDDSHEAIDFARKHYNADNIEYAVVDLSLQGSIPRSKLFDAIVAFEIIEHLPDTEKTFDMFNTISPKLIILSTPHLYCPIGGNQFHHRHYGMDELIDRFWKIGYSPKRAELIYFGTSLCNFMVMERR